MNEKKKFELLQKEIVIPDIVQEKADAAFEAIRRTSENAYTGAGKDRIPAASLSCKKHRRKIAVTAFAAALAVCTVSAGAAVYLNWSSGLEKELGVTQEQKQSAEVSGLADFPGMSVTDAGVTVTAQQSIVDNYYAFLSFKVEGYSVEQGIQPAFGNMNLEVDGNSVTNFSSFYDGLVADENGKAVLADGSPIPLDEEGNFLIDYVQDDGSLEYHITLSSGGEKGAFLDKPIHVEFTDLGFYPGKAETVTAEIKGNWAFDWTLQGDDSVYTAQCSEALGDTGATVIGAEISPISIKAVYEFPRAEVSETGFHESQEMVDGELTQVSEPFEYTHYVEPPYLMGVQLKDGTRLSSLYMGPGQSGYVDEESDQYVYMYAVNRILDVDEVQGLLFGKGDDDGEVFVVDIR